MLRTTSSQSIQDPFELKKTTIVSQFSLGVSKDHLNIITLVAKRSAIRSKLRKSSDYTNWQKESNQKIDDIGQLIIVSRKSQKGEPTEPNAEPDVHLDQKNLEDRSDDCDSSILSNKESEKEDENRASIQMMEQNQLDLEVNMATPGDDHHFADEGSETITPVNERDRVMLVQIKKLERSLPIEIIPLSKKSQLSRYESSTCASESTDLSSQIPFFSHWAQQKYSFDRRTNCPTFSTIGHLNMAKFRYPSTSMMSVFFSMATHRHVHSKDLPADGAADSLACLASLRREIKQSFYFVTPSIPRGRTFSLKNGHLGISFLADLRKSTEDLKNIKYKQAAQPSDEQYLEVPGYSNELLLCETRPKTLVLTEEYELDVSVFIACEVEGCCFEDYDTVSHCCLSKV